MTPLPTPRRSSVWIMIALALPMASTVAAMATPSLDLLGRRPHGTHRRRGRGLDPAMRAALDRVRSAAFRPFDDPAAGRRIDYGGRHPFEIHERRRRAEEERLRRRGLTSTLNEFDFDGGGGIVPNRGTDNGPAEEHFGVGALPRGSLRIHFETTALEGERGVSDEKDRRIDLVLDTVLPAIGRLWSDALSVVPVEGPIPITSDVCWGYAGVDKNFTVDGADVVVLVGARQDEELGCVDEEGERSSALAVAAPCEADQWDRPTVGFINFCLEGRGGDDGGEGGGDDGDDGGGDIWKTPEEEVLDLISIGAHEVGHALGMVDEMLKYFRDKETGDPLTPRRFKLTTVKCVDGKYREVYRPSESVLAESEAENGVRHFEIVTERVATVVRNRFNCPTMRGARLENQPTGASCFGSHLDERLFFTDLMGPVYSSFVNALSPVTLAFFEDSGWYRANYTHSAPSVFGHGAGCDFVYGDCIVDGEVPDYSAGFFCADPLKPNRNGDLRPSALTCDPSRTHKAVCDLVDLEDFEEMGVIDDAAIPTLFQYFPDNKHMGAIAMPLADYCPIPNFDYEDCQDPTNRADGEYFGEDSRCYDVEDRDGFSTVDRISACLRTRCDPLSNRIEVTFDGRTVPCDHDGQEHFLGNSYYLTCPRFAVVCPHLVCPAGCSGRGICNWDAPGGPRCECFDSRDSSAGCYGDGIEPTPPPTGAPTTPPTEPPTEKQPGGGGGIQVPPNFGAPEDDSSSPTTEPPVYDGPAIRPGPWWTTSGAAGRNVGGAAFVSYSFGAVVALWCLVLNSR